MKTRLAAFAFAFAVGVPAALAEVPNACEVLKIEEINSIAGGAVSKVQPQRTGNPSVCGFMDSHQGAVLVVSIREVQYAAPTELQVERENLEKIYKSRVKWLTGTVGENGFWMPVNKQVVFLRKKKIVSVTFSRAQNQNEVDTSQIARLVDSRL